MQEESKTSRTWWAITTTTIVTSQGISKRGSDWTVQKGKDTLLIKSHWYHVLWSVIRTRGGWSDHKILSRSFGVESWSMIWIPILPTDLVELVITWFCSYGCVDTKPVTLIQGLRPNSQNLCILFLLRFYSEGSDRSASHLCCFDASFRLLVCSPLFFIHHAVCLKMSNPWIPPGVSIWDPIYSQRQDFVPSSAQLQTPPGASQKRRASSGRFCWFARLVIFLDFCASTTSCSVRHECNFRQK